MLRRSQSDSVLSHNHMWLNDTGVDLVTHTTVQTKTKDRLRVGRVFRVLKAYSVIANSLL